MNALAERSPDVVSVHAPHGTRMAPMDMVLQVIHAGQPIEVVREVMALSRELKQEQAREAFDDAIANAKAEIKPVQRNREGHNKKMYADFAAFAKEIDPIISKFGLSYRFRTAQTDKITVTCVVSHREGYSEENSLSGPSDTSGNKNAIQAIGSTLTYLQRYTLTQAFGLAADADDDGNKSEQTQEQAKGLTEVQTSVILDLIAKAELENDQFCGHWKVKAVPEISSSKYNEVIGSLRRRIAVIAEKKADQNG
jgi:hypothetical protein